LLLNDVVILLGLPPGSAPVIGRIGTSPAALQPGPLMCVSAYPVSWVSP
jgi:hypothetical protein